MIHPQIKHEGWLYWLAFLIAVGFRFLQLGASPLTDSEATLALQALHVAQGVNPLLEPQPAYILFTGVFFALLEATNFLARFLPALAGSALVFVPWFFREKIKPRAALILAFLFAFDPGLVALSRMANGTMPAVTFLLFAWAMWNHQRLIVTGIFAGLALLSGPSLWAGALTLGLTWIFLKGMDARPAADESQIENPKSKIVNQESPASTPPNPRYEGRTSLLSLLATLLLGGTLFFTVPNGLSAWLSSISAYFTGWVTPNAATPGRILITFAGYELLGIFLASLAIFRGVRTKGKRFIRLIVWLGVSLLLAIFYRQAGELAWGIVPLLALGALELARAFDVHREERVEIGVVVIAILILLVYIWFNVSSVALNPFNQFSTTVPIFGEIQNPRALVLFGSLAIVVVCILLVATGWSARVARLGVTWSFAAFIGLYSLAAAWGASGLRYPNGVELWTPDPKPHQTDLLIASVNDISEFSLGHAQSQPVTVFGIDSPALEWALRDHDVEVVSALDPQIAPPIVITPIMNDPGLPSAYRGQDFTWRRRPQWEVIQNADWIKWFVFRELPMENETIILWARTDLFPDARGGAQP